NLPSAFVFGIVKPVLVLPADIVTDEKVILHELIHLKYKDLWQKVMWSLLRVLHWPNLLLQYCFELINNDMESLRDQRVLELLQGEERRDYGRILLSMTNDRYPSAFGTTSISNGASFIAERIKTIARFKKYPQGMGFVSVCIVFMMIPLVANGRGTPEKLKHINYAKKGKIEHQMQYEEYRMAQLTTPAAALDAYAKMITLGGDKEAIKLAITPYGIVTPEYKLPDISKIHTYESDLLYFVVDMQKKADDRYTAGLMLKDFYRGENGEGYGTNYYVIPVTLINQNGWKIYQSGDYSYHNLAGIMDNTASPPATDDYKGGVQIEYETAYGRVKLVADNISWNDDVDNNMYVYPYTQFSSSRVEIQTSFKMNENCNGYPNIAFSVAGMENDAEYKNYIEEMHQYLNISETAGTSSAGYSFINVPMDRATGAYEGIIRNSLIQITDDFTLPEKLQIDIWLGNENVAGNIVDLKTGKVYEK
ncbi:MAG: M56 family metallopeptidase, partial [Oscillospiraceae bacterium]|nr:M56 family metallopeptidase [Oscillospiraceae bacterium]